MKRYNLASQITHSQRSLPTMLVGLIRESILSGEIKEGTQLKQEELAVKYGVSISALREALKGLEAEGLVKFYPNRGAMVTELSVEEAQEIFDIRLFLELGALELAIPNMTEADFTAAAEILAAANEEGAGAKWGELNWQFHEVLYRQTKRPKLLELIRQMHNNVERYMRLYLFTLHYQTCSQAEHQELLAACRKGDIALAQQWLRRHMAAASERLVEYLLHTHNA
ncbi:MAG: GntR family transcriptional regulator [Sporomusaceae bacterium]|nr:GntR family transcriptional regulator [Sporomusaceae bacterium]